MRTLLLSHLVVDCFVALVWAYYRFKGARVLLDQIWTVCRAVAQAAWGLICWWIVPVVFGYLAYASITKANEISVLQICLTAIALSPWILRLLARYLSEFDIGLKGVSGKTRETVKNKDEIDTQLNVVLANEAEPEPPPESEFSQLMPEAKKVLRTLWKFQVEQFGPDDIRRWGFAVGAGAPDYQEFMLGITQPLMRHLIAFGNDRQFVFLTEAGINFCKEHNEEISNYPLYYSHFTN